MPQKTYHDLYANKFVINSGQTGATVVDDLTVGGAATVAETLAVTGASNLTGAVTVTGVTTMNGNELATGPGTGITAGTGTVAKTSVVKVGDVYTTEILIDLTGLNSQATDLDIIGVNSTANPCHFGRITAAECGTILTGTMRCLEVPAGGDPNVALYSATEGTGVEDGGIGALTETLLFDPNADWTIDMDRTLTAVPAADQYLYLVQGDATGTNATYTAGKFLITLKGY